MKRHADGNVCSHVNVPVHSKANMREDIMSKMSMVMGLQDNPIDNVCQ